MKTSDPTLRIPRNAAERLWLQLPAGLPEMRLARFDGREALGEMFRFDLLLDADRDFDRGESEALARATLRQPVAFGFRRTTGEMCRRHGLATHLTRENRRRWRLTVSPWLHLLALHVDSRVWVDKRVPEIIAAVCDELGCHDYRFDLAAADYRKWPQCIQYRESAANFICRLLEQEGIFFYWEHLPDEQKHVMVMTDTTARLPRGYAMPVRPEVEKVNRSGRGDERLRQWCPAWQIAPESYTIADYNHQTPEVDLTATAHSADLEHGRHGMPTVFDGRGEIFSRDEASKFAERRQELLDSRRFVTLGAGNLGAIQAGGLLAVAEADADFVATSGVEYLVVSVRHEADESRYANSFECLPADRPYRPAPTTPKPTIPGIQPAIVVGRSDEELDEGIDTLADEFGRVRIRFLWTNPRRGKSETSAWIRVAQAGGQWRLPRVGEEVFVMFEDGDPDRPIVVGQGYPVPRAFPVAKGRIENRHAIVQASRDEIGKTANEIVFDGEKGAEQMRIVTVGNLVEAVGGDHVTAVNGDRESVVEGEERCKCKKSKKERIDDDLHLEAGGNAGLIAEKTLVFQAETIILKSKRGGSYVCIGAQGIEIQGAPLTKINCGGRHPKLPDFEDATLQSLIEDFIHD